MKKYNITVAKNAFKMLDQHIIFLARVSPKKAHSLRRTFINTVKSLVHNPKRHPLWLPNFELPNSYHKVMIKKRYLILFYIHNNNIFVDYLLDCRMDNNIAFNSLFSQKI